MTQASVRRAIGIVPQDTVLFNDTVAYNIAYGRTGATQQHEVEQAAAPRAHPRLHRRHAQGLRHHGGRAGLKLSGGEKQRVAIAARCSRTRPSSSSTGHQRAGFRQRTRHPGRAAKRCAEQDHAADCHRLSTVVDAHEILVMDAGRIIERGNHPNCWPSGAATPACGPCNKAMAPPDSTCFWNLKPMKPVSAGFDELFDALPFPVGRTPRPDGRGVEVVYARCSASAAAAIAEHGPRVRIALTIGAIGLSPAQIDALPALTLICVLGAGYENVAVDHAKARGIVVATGAGTNDDRPTAPGPADCRAAPHPAAGQGHAAGVWRTALPLPPNVSHKRLGIIGLGTIGKIAQRALGFEIEGGLPQPAAYADVPATATLPMWLALAEWADFLVIATPVVLLPGIWSTPPVLNALGRAAWWSTSRGSVIDTTALAAALREATALPLRAWMCERTCAPAELLDLDNVVLTPHVAGWSPEAVQNSVDRFMENARRHLAGKHQ